jgi:hypothetical protein
VLDDPLKPIVSTGVFDRSIFCCNVSPFLEAASGSLTTVHDNLIRPDE